MQYDEIVTQLGKYGPYQGKVYLMACILSLFSAIHNLGVVFIMPSHKHRCAIPELANDTYHPQGDWHSDVIRRWIPWDEALNATSSCRVRVLNQTSYQMTNVTMTCSHYVYDESAFHATVTSDIDLVCDRTSLTTYANMAFMGGGLAGSFVLGAVSDRIGRKKSLMLCIVCTQLAVTALAFIESYALFVLVRLVTGFFGSGFFFISFVIGMEVVHPQTRKYAGLVIEIFWVLGNLLNVTLAYLIRDWRNLQLATALSQVFLLSYAFLMPESPRWLIQKGRDDEAVSILQKAAKANKVTLPDKLEGLIIMTGNDGKSENIWKISKSKTLLVRSSVIFYIWFVSSLVYYGLTLNVGSLHGDIYLNFTLSSVVEGLSYVFAILILDWAGRRSLVCYPLMLAGIACLGTMFPVMYAREAMQWMVGALFLIGKFGVSIAFAVVYMYSAEIFPTSVRNSAVGLCNFMGRAGAIIAPYIADLGKIISGNMGIALPLIIFGGSAILAGVLTRLLPETTNRLLPETIDDAKSFNQRVPSKRANVGQDSPGVISETMEMSQLPGPEIIAGAQTENGCSGENGSTAEKNASAVNSGRPATVKSLNNGREDVLVFKL